MFNLTLHHKVQLYLHKKGHELFIKEYNDYIANTYDGKRSPMNFIDNFLDYTQKAESPESFFRWAALSSISATMRDNIYLKKDVGEKVYGNLYVILVARSGACRKGVPLKVSLGLLNQIKNTKIISGRTSIQAVVKKLSENITNGTPNAKGDYMIGGASGILYSEELAAFLVEDKSTIGILTNIYDFHEEWTNELKASDTERLKNVCVSMLAASNLDLLKEVYTETAKYGGLLARTVLVMEEKRRHRNSRVFEDQQDPDEDKKKMNLILHLRKIAAAKGIMKYTREAAEVYDYFYNNDPVMDDKNFGRSGVEARIGTTIEKVAMCLSMAEDNFDLLIHKNHIQEAMDLCIPLIPNYQYLTMSAGATTSMNPSTWAVELLRSIAEAPNRELSTAHILRKFVGRMTLNDLKSLTDTMIQAKYLIGVNDPSGKEGIIYRAEQKLIDKLNGKGGENS